VKKGLLISTAKEDDWVKEPGVDGVVKRNTSTLLGINPQSVVIQPTAELPS
jgi:hypothetical protein